MSFDQDDVLFGLGGGDPMDMGDAYASGSPLGLDANFHDHFRSDPMGDPSSPNMHGLNDIPYHDNSLAIPLDDYQAYSTDLQGDSRDFQTLQPPVSSYDLEMGSHSQSSMGMGGYSNGGTNEGMMYEQATIVTNGDHQMMGSEEHFGMVEMKPSTSYGNYQPSPMGDLHGSPSVSHQQSRPNSRIAMNQKGSGGLQHHLSTPSTSNNYSNTPVLPVKTIPVNSASSSSKKPANRQNNGRKSKIQAPNTVGAVLTKANRMANAPATNSDSLRFSKEDSIMIAQLSGEIESLKSDRSRDHSAKITELEGKRAAIFYAALAASAGAGVSTPSITVSTQQRPRTSHKKQIAPSSPAYTPQCGSTYVPQDSYGGGPGPSHGGYTATPSAPPMQRSSMYKVTPTTVAAPSSSLGNNSMYLQGQGPPPQGGPMGGQPPPPTITPSTTTPQMTRKMAGVSGRMVIRGHPPIQQMNQSPVDHLQQHPSISAALQQHQPGLTVKAALKQQQQQMQSQMQQHSHIMQQQQQQPVLQPHPNHQQVHHLHSMPSTSSGPQPLLQLSLPVYQQPQHIKVEDVPFRPTPMQTKKRMDERLQSRTRRMANTFEVMSAQLLQPDTEIPFAGLDDIFRRCIPYHLLYEHDMDPQLEEEFDLQYARSVVNADEGILKIRRRMQEIALNEAMARKDEERNLLLFLDVDYEKQRLEEEKKMAKEQPDVLIPLARQTALYMATASLPPPSARLAALKQPSNPSYSSLYESHPFVERHRIPTPPPIGPLHGLEESEAEEETEDESEPTIVPRPTSSAPLAVVAAAAAPPPAASLSDDDDDQASPEMGVIDDLPPPPAHTVPHPPLSTVSSPAGRSRPSAPPKVPAPPSAPHASSPARSKVGSKAAGTTSKGELPAALPPPLAVRNRMMEDRMKEEERRKKVQEREERAAEERRKREEERKERERRKKEEERARAEEEKREREEKERRRREEEEERERREAEERKKEEEKKVIMPLKIRFKMAAREEDRKMEEAKREEEETERKSKKKKKKEKRKREHGEDDEEERERKRRKKERKERERQQQAAATPGEARVPDAPIAAAAVAAPAAATPTVPKLPKLKIKLGEGRVTTSTTIAASEPAAGAPVAPSPINNAAVAAAATPARPVPEQQQQQRCNDAPPSEPPTSGIRLKIKLPPPPPSTEPEPEKRGENEERKRREAKEQRRREKEERREKKENSHSRHEKGEKERDHHKHKDSSKAEKRQHSATAAEATPVDNARSVAPVVKITPVHDRPPPVQQQQQLKLQQPAPTPPSSASPALQMQLQQIQHTQLLQQQQSMIMNTFRPSVIAQSLPTPQQLQPIFPSHLLLPPAAAVAGLPNLLQQSLLPMMTSSSTLPTPLMPTIPSISPVIRTFPLPPGVAEEEKSPERVVFSDSEDEDLERSNSLHKSAAALNRMVGHAPTMLPPHHHRLPQIQQTTIPQVAFPWNNQYK